MEDEALDVDERIARLTATRAWPWMQPGAVSVGLDDEGHLVRYAATQTALVPVAFDDTERSTSG